MRILKHKSILKIVGKINFHIKERNFFEEERKN